MTRAGSASQPDHQTLRKPEDFRRVLARGSRRRAGPIVVVRAPGPTGPPRVGLVVTRDSGNAVTRNRIKRRLRHAVAGIGLQPGSDYVILANREVSKVAYADLVWWLTEALT